MIHRGVMALILCVAACESRYGTYLEIDGEAGGMTFDRVELYFGLPHGDTVPSTPSFGSQVPGRLYKRLFTASDLVDAEAAGSTVRFYVPPSEENQGLGAYVLAVAYAGDVPVGIGELADFIIETGSVVRTYDLALEPYDAALVEQWGAGDGPGCVRWTRVDAATGEKTTVAVVRRGDNDCDGLEAEVADCDDLSFCGADGEGCTGTRCVDRETCGLGVCVSGDAGVTCQVDTCLVSSVCGACADVPDAELLTCALERAPDHTQITIPTSLGPDDPQALTRLCGTSVEYQFALPGGFPCKEPQILAPKDGITPDGFKYTFIDGGAVCFLKIAALSSNTGYLYDDAAHHVVLSVLRGDLPELRSTLLLGIQPADVPTEQHLPCGAEPLVSHVVDDYGLCQ